MSEWKSAHAKEAWIATEGPEYLTLVKGELLQVREDVDGSQSGWAYAYSVQRSIYGWVPPTYLRKELA